MVDPAGTPLGKMLLEEITPVVMVLSTPLVEKACLKSGLSLVDMLTPFCNFDNIDVPVRTSSDQPYRLQRFKLRLFYASDVRQPNLEAAKDRLKQAITHAADKDFQELTSEPPQIRDVLASPESDLLPTWFQYYNKELVRTFSFSDHEAFDHPVACLLAVSSKDEEPINKLVDLFNNNTLPSLLNSGVMDPKILKHYLLVHDGQDGTTESAAKVLAEMRSTFGVSNCQLVCINSSKEGCSEYQQNPWHSSKSDGSSVHELGCSLNADDINEIRDLMQELSSKYIIPYMEQKVRALNLQVSATRKGFRNQFKNLWWRKGKEDGSDSTSGPIYTYSSIESQIRILGDYAFMLHDYELALSSYRLISTDYKLDKAWKRYAGVQEMMGLSYFISDQSQKEAEYCMENAFSTYLRIGSSGLQYATRCGLWWAEMLKARDQYREAASVYFRICGEEPLHAAVMLEQASYCYLLSKPAMLHKYGFHLVLSGDHYKKCDQVKHAIRTFRRAISVYKGTAWSHIKDHVYFSIGQWYAFIGMHDVAVTNMLEVLACSYQSKALQELFLRDFLQIVQTTGKKHEVVKLQLPIINMSSLMVIFEDHRTYASPEAAAVEERFWNSLEEDITPSMTTARSNWLEVQSNLLPKKYRESNICVAGEAIEVGIELQNPLQIPISVSHVSLICELSANSDDGPDASGRSIEPQNPAEHETSTPCGVSGFDASPSFTLSEIGFVMGGGEVKSVQLMVTPRVEGILNIVGIRWELSGSVGGAYYFESSPMKIKTARVRRKRKHSSLNNLKLLVIKGLPRLEGSIHPIPGRMYTGNLRHLVLELRNKSDFPVQNLKMKISHPRFLSIGNREDLTKKIPDCLEKQSDFDDGGPCVDLNRISNGVFIFPEDTTIQGETPLLWPLWLRAAVPGKISLYIIIYYEMKNVSSAIRYRILRMHYNLQVLPSLETSFQIIPCLSRLQQYLVRMDVFNRASSGSFQVLQLSSVGLQWEISLLQPVETMLPSPSLSSGQTLSYFFMLKDCWKSAGLENRTLAQSPSSQTDVTLGSPGNRKVIFDTSKSPLADFHASERSNQETAYEGHANTVDFILISRTSEISTAIIDSRLLSHHSCHCSVRGVRPISWLLDAPHTIYHNFTTSFCEVQFKMTITNSSDSIASVHISTFEAPSVGGEPSDAFLNQSGWHYLPVMNDIKVTSDILEPRARKQQAYESVAPFIWSGSSSTKVQIKPLSAVEIPLEVTVFSPGVHDLSSYKLNWELEAVNGQDGIVGGTRTSGACSGYPFYLTALELKDGGSR